MSVRQVAERGKEAVTGDVRRGGFLTWTAVLIGIGAWTVHMLALTSLVKFVCNHHGFEWTLHVITALTAGATLAGMAYCWGMARASDDEESPSVPARTRFLGLAGLLMNSINLALILLEGSYVLFIKPCA